MGAYQQLISIILLLSAPWQMFKHDDIPPAPQPPTVQMCVRHDQFSSHLPPPRRRRHSNDDANAQRRHSNDLPTATTNLDDMIDALDHDITASDEVSSSDVDVISTDRRSSSCSRLSFQLIS